jgi:hypothetical protein
VRQILLVLMLIPPTVNVIGMLASVLQFKRFQRTVAALRTSEDMRRFKRLATIQMYVSLVLLWITVVPPLVWLYGFFFGRVLGWLDLLLYVVLPFVPVLVIALRGADTANAVRATPADDPALAAERDHVAHVWVNRYFPDW